MRGYVRMLTCIYMRLNWKWNTILDSLFSWDQTSDTIFMSAAT